MKRKILSILLTFAMVMSLLPMNLVTVLAEEGDHTHCVCGEANCNKEGHSSITFDKKLTDGGILTSGSYYLADDVILQNYIEIPNGVTVNLCLNGHVLSGSVSGYGIKVNGGTLNLCDCNTATEHKFVPNSYGLWVWNDGATGDEVKTVNGGVITGGSLCGVYNAGRFVMYNGVIAGNSTPMAASGGGVYNDNNSKFEMHGGTIVGNWCGDNGGAGVYNGDNCEFEMHGGTISDNTSNSIGGGVLNDGTFTMSGGSISNNSAVDNGGGVGNDGTFTMSGGSISNNSAGYRGGGVENGGTFTMSGGRITDNSAAEGGGVRSFLGTIKVSGNVRIIDNKVMGESEADNNAYLVNSLFSITDALGEDANIGVSVIDLPLNEDTPTKIAEGGGEPVYTITSDDLAHFSSDNGSYTIKLGEDAYNNNLIILNLGLPTEITQVTITGVPEPADGVAMVYNAEPNTVTMIPDFEDEGSGAPFYVWLESDSPIPANVTRSTEGISYYQGGSHNFQNGKYYAVFVGYGGSEESKDFAMHNFAEDVSATVNGQPAFGTYSGTGEYDHNYVIYNFGQLTSAPVKPSSGGGSGSSVYTPTITVPISSENDKVQTEATVNGTEATVKKTNSEKLDALLEDAVNGGVEIDFSGFGRTIESVKLPIDTLVEISNAVADNADGTDILTIVLSSGTVIFDAATLKAIAEQTDGTEIRLVLDDTETQSLNSKQRESVEELNVYGVIDAYLVDVKTNKRIADFRGGEVTLRIPFDIPDGFNPLGFNVWYVDDNGVMTKHNTYYSNGNLIWQTGHFSDYVIVYDADAAASVNPFKDVKEGDWFYDSVMTIYEKGLMSGTAEDMFSPDLATTRGMIATIVYRMEGEPEVTGECPFGDVAAGSYYEKAIAWAAANGIVAGYSSDVYAPDQNISREQLAAILLRYAKFKGYDVSVGEDTNILSFDDADQITEYAIPAIQWVCGSGLVSGMGDGTLAPQGEATRAQLATILIKFLGNIA